MGDSDEWRLGVCAESVDRRGDIMPRLWRLCFCHGEYLALAPSYPIIDIYVQERPQRIRMDLDWDGGAISFSDAVTNTHIHTFTSTFTERVFAYINNEDYIPLRISPVKVSVTVAQK